MSQSNEPAGDNNDLSVEWTKVEPPRETPSPTPPNPTIAPTHRAIAWLVLLLVVVLVLIGASPFWAPSLSLALPWGHAAPEEPVDNTGPLRARLDAAETAIKTLADKVARLEGNSVAIKDLGARLTRLETIPTEPTPAPMAAAPAQPAVNPETEAALAGLKDQVTKLAADNSATGDRIAKIEGRMTSATAQTRADSALLLALGNLREALAGAAPYADELAAVQALAGDRAEVKDALAPLDTGAASGIPSLAMLSSRFDREVSPAILRASTRSESEDWGDQILSRLRRLVVVRRIGPGAAEPNDPVQAAVTRADASLKSSDLAGAIAALETLSGPSATAAASWLAQAKTRLAAETALAKFWRGESARVAAAPTGAKP